MKIVTVFSIWIIVLVSQAAWAEGRPSSARVAVRAEDGTIFGPAALRRAVSQHLNLQPASSAIRVQRQSSQAASRTWCGRRAVLCGTLLGFGLGYGAGFLLGENPLYDDFVPSADALVVGSLGAAGGAIVGAVLSP